MIFKKKKNSSSESLIDTPIVKEIKLNGEYRFMYENFTFSSQHELYLLLEEGGGLIKALKFKFLSYKYGYPNDEVEHPMMQYGLGFYGFYEVFNSPWINDIVNNNKTHSRHSAELFENRRHYIAKFKDITLEVVANTFEEIQMEKSELIQLMNKEIEFLKE